MCESIEKIVNEANARVEERVMINTVRNASKSFNVSEEDAAEKLGYDVAAYKAAKKHQRDML